jgi:hypothetical protein
VVDEPPNWRFVNHKNTFCTGSCRKSLRFPLEAYNAEGDFLAGLKAGDVVIREDGQELPASRLEVGENGLQVTVALNTHPSMNNAANGSTPYAEIQSALIEWAEQRPTPTPDDFSLATATGLYLIRSTEPAKWAAALRDYQPDLNKAQPNLVGLADALDLATDPLGRPDMKRAILFITPALPPALLSTLPDYTSRARQIGVRIYVWLVAPSDRVEVSPALQDLATQTGGRLIRLTPAEPRPELERQLAHLRQRYEVHYTSLINKSGTHTLSVQIQQGDEQLVSNERSLNLTVLPPNPIFLSPPPSLSVQIAPGAGSAEASYQPQEVPLKILVEFPDQHERSLKATRLFVNDRLVAENFSHPSTSLCGGWPKSTNPDS